MTSHVPILVLRAGDITEGPEVEFRSYLVLIPSGLRDLIQHEPCKQDIRWNVSAYENYEDHFVISMRR